MMDPMDRVHARLDAGLSVSELCQLVGRSERTYRHWRKHGAPDWVADLIRLQAGYLEALGWNGWRIFEGTLYADTGQAWRPGDLYAEWYNRERLKEIDRKRRAEMEARVDTRVTPLRRAM